ncbi:ABC transporter substrate-binding protein [Phocicoccus pinnipedialis]|nr:helical backbone metal receptor [Jeotgalicoccus pinnipedialis]
MLIMITLAACQKEHDTEMRIVSLIPSNTEIVSELGLFDSLVMVTVSDDFPDMVKSDDITKIDTFNFDVEKVIAEKPTHIVSHESINDGISSEIERVKKATGAKVLVVADATSIEDVFRDIETVGNFLGKSQEADDVVERLEAEFTEFKESIEPKTKQRAVVFLSPTPEIYTVGRDTFISSLLKGAGMVNVFSDLKGYPVVSNESLVKHEPQVAINLTDMSDKDFRDMLKSTPGLKSLDITDLGNQCTPDVNLVSRPGPRIIQGMKSLAECFNDEN